MLDAELVKKAVSGFKESNRIIEEERKQRLKSMTTKESSEIYNNLCDFYYTQPQKRDHNKSETLRIEILLRRRKIMNEIAERMRSDEHTK